VEHGYWLCIVKKLGLVEHMMGNLEEAILQA
jgi:hypothetical protein